MKTAAGLLLSLVGAGAINVGFLLQHRALRSQNAGAGQWVLLRAALRSRTWIAGQALGWAGFAAQIAAVAIAPLSLVQAFAAGGLALSVPLASSMFGHRISRTDAAAILLIAFGLASLPIGFDAAHERLDANALIVTVAVAVALAGPAGLVGGAGLRVITAGLFYGAADGAIKAVAVGSGAHYGVWLLSGWAVVAVAATFAGFLSFQTSLRAAKAVSAISLMNATATLTAIACGVLGFGESLGANAVTIGGHAVAIALVLSCLPLLASAQTRLAENGSQPLTRAACQPTRTAGVGPAKGAANCEQQSLQPRTRAGTAAPEHVS